MKIQVKDMNCNNCFNQIKRFLDEIEGIEAVVPEFSQDVEKRIIEIKTNEKVKLEQVLEAIEDAGFTPKAI